MELTTFSEVASDAKGVLPSAWLAKSISSKIINWSHFKMLKSKHPKMDSCGTPNKISSQVL